ncbi:uncharacterized protein UHOD_08691 [Ustilago sp. UG-2017b]|nr:uncharacterized protein UHOD_08691 [Ustilago sp. UG-2017b]
MVSKQILACLTVFLAAGLNYAVSGAAASGLEELNSKFVAAMFHSLNVDTDQFLARKYPNVPHDQRANLGDIPENLGPLIQGADKTGRLLIPAPQPGHALLLTKDVPEYTSSLGPALLHKATPEGNIVLTQAKSWSASKDTVKGFGAITDREGKVHYFRTVPFEPPRPETLPQTGQTLLPDQVAPRSHLKFKKTFGSRPITLKLPSGEFHHSKDKVLLSHISVIPDTGPPGTDLRVYPQPILDEVLKGPPQEVVQRGKEGPPWLVEWSETPNWSRKERKAAKQMEAKPSSTRWFQKLKAPFSRSNSGSRSLSGSDEGPSNSGNSPGGALVGPA